MPDGDALRKVRTGDPLRIPARAYNAFIETARAHAQRSQDRRRDGQPAVVSRDVVLVRNESGENRDRFEVLGIENPIVEPDDNLRQFKSRVALVGVEPTPGGGHHGRFVVLLEPLKAGAIGQAQIDGVGVARVHVHDADDVHADTPGSGDPEGPDPYLLHSSADGSARILWKEHDDQTGPMWCVVRLGDGAGGGDLWRVWRITSAALDDDGPEVPAPRWVYSGVLQTKQPRPQGEGYGEPPGDAWTDVLDDQNEPVTSDRIYNALEAHNTEPGSGVVYGNGIQQAHLDEINRVNDPNCSIPGTYQLHPFPTGHLVWARRVNVPADPEAPESTAITEWWFEHPNAVWGSCPVCA